MENNSESPNNLTSRAEVINPRGFEENERSREELNKIVHEVTKYLNNSKKVDSFWDAFNNNLLAVDQIFKQRWEEKNEKAEDKHGKKKEKASDDDETGFLKKFLEELGKINPIFALGGFLKGVVNQLIKEGIDLKDFVTEFVSSPFETMENTSKNLVLLVKYLIENTSGALREVKKIIADKVRTPEGIGELSAMAFLTLTVGATKISKVSLLKKTPMVINAQRAAIFLNRISNVTPLLRKESSEEKKGT